MTEIAYFTTQWWTNGSPNGIRYMIKNRVKNIKKSQKICVCFCFINVSKTTLLLSLFADESNQAKTRFTRQSKGAATHFDFSSQLLYCFFHGFERPHSSPFLFFFVKRGLFFFYPFQEHGFWGPSVFKMWPTFTHMSLSLTSI